MNAVSILRGYADNRLGRYTPSEIHVFREAADQIESQTAEIDRLRQWVNDLQSGMYVNCVYCGHRYGPEDEVPSSMADALKAHIEQCPEHPMSHLKAELERYRDTELTPEEVQDLTRLSRLWAEAGLDAIAIQWLIDHKETYNTLETQLAAAQRRERAANEAQRCDGCFNQGDYENEVEYGYPSPCTGCVRRASDNFMPLPAAPAKGE